MAWRIAKWSGSRRAASTVSAKFRPAHDSGIISRLPSKRCDCWKGWAGPVNADVLPSITLEAGSSHLTPQRGRNVQLCSPIARSQGLRFVRGATGAEVLDKASGHSFNSASAPTNASSVSRTLANQPARGYFACCAPAPGCLAATSSRDNGNNHSDRSSCSTTRVADAPEPGMRGAQHAPEVFWTREGASRFSTVRLTLCFVAFKTCLLSAIADLGVFPGWGRHARKFLGQALRLLHFLLQQFGKGCKSLTLGTRSTSPETPKFCRIKRNSDSQAGRHELGHQHNCREIPISPTTPRTTHSETVR